MPSLVSSFPSSHSPFIRVDSDSIYFFTPALFRIPFSGDCRHAHHHHPILGRLQLRLPHHSLIRLPPPQALPSRSYHFSSYFTVCNDFHDPHHTLVQQVLKNFSHHRNLRIHLPSGKLYLNDSSSILLHWHAHFDSSLNRCLILAAAATSFSFPRTDCESAAVIPDSFYKNLGEDCMISSLSAATEQHRLLPRIITEHTTLEGLVLTDADGQGLLCMDRDQLEELRKKPITASSDTPWIPAIRMRQWYAPLVELSCGVVLKRATLVAIRPRIGGEMEKDKGLGWIEEEFNGDWDEDRMYADAVRILVKERSHYMEMRSSDC